MSAGPGPGPGGKKMKRIRYLLVLGVSILFLCLFPSLSANASPVIMPDGYLFDPEYYAANNPDVVAAFGDSTEALYRHFQEYGASEGRLPWDPYAQIDISSVPHYERTPVQQEGITYHEVAEAVPGTATLTFAGDVNLEPTYCGAAAAANGLAECFDSGVLDLMRSSDFFMFNNEFTYTRASVRNQKTYTFKADPAFAGQLKDIGTDLVSVANNHTYDYLRQGLLDTLDNLKKAEVPCIGAGRNRAEAEAPYYIKAGNTTAAVIAATAITGAIQGAGSSTPGVFLCLDPTDLLNAVKDAKTKADIVIVFVHWGTEKKATPDARQLRLAQQLHDAGCDIVIGAHSHCLETLGYVGDMPVVYSLGNYLFSHSTRSTCLYQVTLDTDQGIIRSTQFIPVTTSNGTYLQLPGEQKKASMLQYMRSISPDVNIDSSGYVTKK